MTSAAAHAHVPKLRTSADVGAEKLCTRCMEWWPADGEFFNSDRGDPTGLFYCCKACYREWKNARAPAPPMSTSPLLLEAWSGHITRSEPLRLVHPADLVGTDPWRYAMTATESTLPSLGESFGGGFYAGRFRIDSAVFGLIVSPRAGGDVKSKWSAKYLEIDARSFIDGLANTTAMAEAGIPLAKTIQALSIGGYTDWYLPARDELELLYRAFKPTREKNHVWRNGENPSALPPTYPYTDDLPAQTSALAFQEGGPEAFEARLYWSSTQHSRDYAWSQGFDGGGQDSLGTSYEGRARAVRRFTIE